MKVPRQRSIASIAKLLIVALTLSNMAFAESKPITAAAVHERIFKRGVDRWIYVKEDNDIVLVGRITSIGVRSFNMRVQDESQPTEVFYNDVIDVRTGIGHKGLISFGIFAAAGIGTSVALAVHFQNESNKLLQPPTHP
ncbi:hypothetical protein [Acidicapsa ligni]|uniref:hypothetical protein n=1 Tax=Acidicapsa ligni TaxID=542300 RepID=UPI0021DF4BBA|nr:hypothetical protein [Acidicapsa ligni]